MDIHFIDQANYYLETLHPLGQSSIGGVKRDQNAPQRRSVDGLGYEEQLSARRGNLATGERLLRTCLDGLRQTQYGVLYTPFLGDLAEVLATAGRLDDSLAAADEALRRTERSDGFRSESPKQCGHGGGSETNR